MSGLKARYVEWSRLAGREPSYSKPPDSAWREDSLGDDADPEEWLLGLGDKSASDTPADRSYGSAALGLSECLMPCAALQRLRSCVFIGTAHTRRQVLQRGSLRGLE